MTSPSVERQPPREEGDSSLPSANVRTTVSLLLFVHLFALAAAIFTNLSPVPVTEPPEQPTFREKLRDVTFMFRYLQILGMDRAYGDPLTQGLSRDVDHFLTISLEKGDAGENANQSLEFPRRDLGMGLRGEHYRQLVRELAWRAENEDDDGELTRVVLQGLLKRHHAHRAKLLCRGHLLMDVEDVRLNQNPNDDGYWRTVFEADAKLSDGELVFSRKLPPVETAPVPKPEKKETAQSSPGDPKKN